MPIEFSIGLGFCMHRVLAASGLVCLVAAALPAPSPAQGRERTRAGTLVCDISGGIDLIVIAKKELACIFTPSQPGPREVYVGSIAKFGLEARAGPSGEMVWSVYAPAAHRFGMLAGHYGGARTEERAGRHVLVGGLERAVSLQPLSFPGQAGFNVATGVAELDLRPAR